MRICLYQREFVFNIIPEMLIFFIVFTIFLSLVRIQKLNVYNKHKTNVIIG